MMGHKWQKTWCEKVWAEHKYLVMLHSYRDYRSIAQSFRKQLHSSESTRSWEAFSRELLSTIAEVYKKDVDAGNAKNALAHAFGHLKRQCSAEESEVWTKLLATDWQKAWEALFSLAMRHGDPYLKSSRLFAPTAPIGHAWIRWNKQDWLILDAKEKTVLLSDSDVGNKLPQLTEAEKVEYRLIARLGSMTSPLEIYEKLLVRGVINHGIPRID
ncbi:hypothetical protein AV540_06970 [Brevibacillus parabrevis]|uniref:DUF1722 domain-containing protein n=1 Tax=Brevibacillus parabrevis TaxID=54914 RepID=UPI0007ABA22E|nr:DUF1722 domain-containing protein [Brevibacillus parabrevis]KZE53965.1 hypothetical protein AV540_06970 [Brevibacillus parabrevis]